MNTVGLVLLIGSLVDLTLYLIALHKLYMNPGRPGLIRTTLCRVLGSCLYTVVAMATLTGRADSALISLLVILVVRVMWQANSIADVRLGRHGRHIRGNND
jgi:hypothetical protein